MQATITLDEELVNEAKELAGVEDTSSLVRLAIECLVQREAGRRLIALGGSDPNAAAPPRRRFEAA